VSVRVGWCVCARACVCMRVYAPTHSVSVLCVADLTVSFATEPYKRDYILQKRRMILHRWLHASSLEAAVYTWTSHATDLNESRHTYECAMLHVWMSHVTHEMCVTWFTHVSHVGESCHITRMNEAEKKNMCVGRLGLFTYIYLY